MFDIIKYPFYSPIHNILNISYALPRVQARNVQNPPLQLIAPTNWWTHREEKQTIHRTAVDRFNRISPDRAFPAGCTRIRCLFLHCLPWLWCACGCVVCAHKLRNTHTREWCTTHVCEPKAGCNPSTHRVDQLQRASMLVGIGTASSLSFYSTARSPSRIPSVRRVWNKVSLFYLHKTCSVRCGALVACEAVTPDRPQSCMTRYSRAKSVCVLHRPRESWA